MILAPGLHRFADLSVGDRVETAEEAVTERMIDAFAALTGDRYEIHMSDAAARAAGFPRRVAHGLLVLSLMDGLKNRAPARLDALASLGWDMRFEAPVLAGEPVRATFEVTRLRRAASGTAVAEFEASGLVGERMVQSGTMVLAMRG